MKKHYKGLGHVAIYTNDIEMHIAYYEKIGAVLTARSELQTPAGPRRLALLDFAGLVIEIVQPPTGFTKGEGAIPHMAIRVDDVQAAGDDLKALGIDTFRTEKPNVNPQVFDGVINWFFEGPSGEVIELLSGIEA